MHNFEDMIEKYRRELIEISKLSPIHNEEERPTTEVFAAAQEQLPEPVQPQAVIAGRVPFADYDEFIRNNPSQGILRTQVFTADQAFPVSGAAVRVYIRLLEGERELFSGTTDVDGVADNIRLPAPDSSVSFDENSTIEPYAVYSLRVNKPGYSEAVFEGIHVFDSVTSIQPVELVPLSSDGNEPKQTVNETEPMVLFGGER